MTDKSKRSTDISFGGPAVYRVVVQGLLDETWGHRLAGMEIATVDRGKREPHTELRGLLQDQAELSGILETLHDLHMSIICVEQIDDEN